MINKVKDYLLVAAGITSAIFYFLFKFNSQKAAKLETEVKVYDDLAEIRIDQEEAVKAVLKQEEITNEPKDHVGKSNADILNGL